LFIAAGSSKTYLRSAKQRTSVQVSLTTAKWLLSVPIWQQTVIGALLPWTCTRDAGQHLYLASRSAADQLAVRRNLSGSSDPQMRLKEDERDLLESSAVLGILENKTKEAMVTSLRLQLFLLTPILFLPRSLILHTFYTESQNADPILQTCP
jgi:hypothetical protein